MIESRSIRKMFTFIYSPLHRTWSMNSFTCCPTTKWKNNTKLWRLKENHQKQSNSTYIVVRWSYNRLEITLFFCYSVFWYALIIFAMWLREKKTNLIQRRKKNNPKKSSPEMYTCVKNHLHRFLFACSCGFHKCIFVSGVRCFVLSLYRWTWLSIGAVFLYRFQKKKKKRRASMVLHENESIQFSYQNYFRWI